MGSNDAFLELQRQFDGLLHDVEPAIRELVETCAEAQRLEPGRDYSFLDAAPLVVDAANVRASPASNLSVDAVARREGLDPNEAMWLLRPDVAVLAEIPIVGDHDDIDALALPEARRPPEDAPLAELLVHLGGLLCRRLAVALPWGWVTIWDSGANLYQQHPSGRRRAKQFRPGYQPLDVQWLDGGDRSSIGTRALAPPPGPSAVVPARPGEGQQSRALWANVTAAKQAAQARTGRRRD